MILFSILQATEFEYCHNLNKMHQELLKSKQHRNRPFLTEVHQLFHKIALHNKAQPKMDFGCTVSLFPACDGI